MGKHPFQREIVVDMGVEPKIGGFYPPKWMVKIMVPNPIKIRMIWGEKPLFLETPIFSKIDTVSTGMSKSGGFLGFSCGQLVRFLGKRKQMMDIYYIFILYIVFDYFRINLVFFWIFAFIFTMIFSSWSPR